MSRTPRWTLPFTLAAAIFAAGTAAQDAVAQELPEGVTAEMVEQGKEVFSGPGLCSTCHGEGAVGTPIAPDLTDDQWLHIDGSFDAIVEIVKTGVATPKEHPVPMLAKGGSTIDDAQVKAVAAYIWKLSHGG